MPPELRHTAFADMFTVRAGSGWAEIKGRKCAEIQHKILLCSINLQQVFAHNAISKPFHVESV